MSFVEKRNYTPEINIEYVDPMGRLLSQKEVSCEIIVMFPSLSDIYIYIYI